MSSPPVLPENISRKSSWLDTQVVQRKSQKMNPGVMKVNKVIMDFQFTKRKEFFLNSRGSPPENRPKISDHLILPLQQEKLFDRRKELERINGRSFQHKEGKPQLQS
ncbi:hypothetical protein AVEN_31855-1 [Araneus ventricosus]|uniref:Uncharacterized protein n=1 Tax=Araneus ventricosus TaxID=182803 RepID=A0A4Y2F7R7_ARAVE|nr:hypothetical protein AVEN_31855-1 [Araneus ventricosus]